MTTQDINANQNLFDPEPLRDWSLGFITGHRLWVILLLLSGTALLYLIQHIIWPVRQQPQTTVEHIWAYGAILWCAPFIFNSLGLLGIVLFRHPKNLDEAERIENLVCWRIVSRGINVETLTTTIRRCQAEMAKTPLFPYVIEIVTDTESIKLPAPNKDLRYIVVPKEYSTAKGTLYKARALHFASQYSNLSDNAWVVHLDEETQPTSSGIKGICNMIREEETSGKKRIGQGAILYHRKWKQYPALTLADNIRTGTDFAQFHLQHKLGVTIFGFHGSYIVVRNDVEKSIGFDFGPEGSITEDAFWGLVAMERGFRSRWVEGYLEEQSTQSVMDFLRQRRRWIQGLAKVALHAPVKLKWRASIGFNTIIWNLGPFAALYTIAHFFFGFAHPWWLRFMANFSFASYILLYLTGLKANLDEHRVENFFKRASWYFVQIVLFPIFSLMESLAVLMALRPISGFHVVKK